MSADLRIRSGNLRSPGNLFAASAARPAKIAAYYANWSAYCGYTPLSVPAGNLSYLNYAFAKIGEDLKISLGDPRVDPANFQQLKRLKERCPQLQTLISVGGWSDSGKFSDAALTEVSRAVFADSVMAFITRYGFNGVDIDWEYPVSGGLTGNQNRSADKVNFTLLLKKLREKLDAQGKADGSIYLLTIAGGAGYSYTEKTQLDQIAKYVDYATIMTYDIHGPWEKYTDLNAPLFPPSQASHQYQWSAAQAVDAWEAAGFPAAKIMLGIPFYGHRYTCVSGGGTGLYQPFQKAVSISYDTVRAKYLCNRCFLRYSHPSSLVPWLFDGSTFISYDDEGSLACKARYILQSHLAGASVWELSQNRDGRLLYTLALYQSPNDPNMCNTDWGIRTSR